MHAPRWIRIVAAAAASVCAGVLVAPRESLAYTTAGWSLGVDQRKVGVCDNFTDASANDNVAQHPNWPGYSGVELACWKAVSEWQSELFGDGSGDPLQADGIGSGGANFDPVWCGAVSTIGGSTGNTISEISGSGGGVIAFTEFGSGGWRIRLYSEWTWDDGPGAPIPGALDVQACVTHEYGHALGLGHSTVTGATMSPTISGDGTGLRSIEADDRAGLQAVYGALGASKPHVASAVVTGGELVLSGTGFLPASEVWMTRKYVDPTPAPDVITNVTPFPDGTLHVSALGDVGAVVVRVPGTGGDALSNSYPLRDAPGATFAYCVAKPNSLGCTSIPYLVGTLSASSPSGALVICDQLLNKKSGLVFYGTSGAYSLAFGGGTLCVHPPVRRLAVHSTGGSPPPAADCTGSLQYDLNARIASGADPSLVAGTVLWLQGWSRDPGFAPPNAIGLTAGLRATVGP
jgi:hypothetical protein